MSLRSAALLVALAASLAFRSAPAAAQPVVDPSGQALDAFFRALARVEAGEPTLARVLQVGDSHTACDLWTGAVRRRLQARFGDGGHGFVVPGRPWAQYAHLDVLHGQRDPGWRVERLRPAHAGPAPFGVGGVALDAVREKARLVVGTRPGKGLGAAVSRFDLFYLQQPRGGGLLLRLDGRQILELSTRWPEARPGFRQIEAPDGSHRLEIEARGPGAVRVFGVALERRGPGVVVDSVGVPGLRAESLLATDRSMLEAHLVRRNPDLLVVAFGAVESVHDGFDPAAYPARLEEVVVMLRRGAPAASCLILAPPDRAARDASGDYRSPPALAALVDAQRRAAAGLGCAFWDTRAAMGGEGASHVWFGAGRVQRDHVHPNARGYEALGGLLADALLERYAARRPALADSGPGSGLSHQP
jgi:lysophospholipase L1-like esterase